MCCLGGVFRVKRLLSDAIYVVRQRNQMSGTIELWREIVTWAFAQPGAQMVPLLWSLCSSGAGKRGLLVEVPGHVAFVLGGVDVQRRGLGFELGLVLLEIGLKANVGDVCREEGQHGIDGHAV